MPSPIDSVATIFPSGSHNFITSPVLPKKFPSHWPEGLALALYATCLAIAVPYHEPWADEAQAWQLARTLSLPALFTRYIRYEGSPGLWHLLLWIFNKLHVNYTGLHWICAAIATAGVSVLILKSPFPRYLRLLLPFTSFLLFQYAVIARNYVLAPLLLFLIAANWKKRPAILAILLGLLANVALHTTVVSAGLALLLLYERLRNPEPTIRQSRRELLIGASIFLVFFAFALWTAWPPRDLLLSRVRGESRPLITYAFVSLVWGVCQPWVLSIVFWIVIAVCLHTRKRLLYLLPVLFFAIFSGAVYANWWHVGLLVPLVITLLWITWPPAGTPLTRPESIGRAAVLFMAITQILWCGYALVYDHIYPYSPDLAASKFLRPFVEKNTLIAVTYLDQHEGNGAFDSVGLLPYFDKNIFINQPTPFWEWSSNNPTEALFATALRSHPPIVLVELRQPHPDIPIDLQSSKPNVFISEGYKLTNVFCGAKPERLQAGENICHLVFQPAGQPSSSP